MEAADRRAERFGALEISRILALFLVVGGATTALAQAPRPPAIDEATRAELARLRDEAIAHDDAGRYALAAESYQELYDGMTRVHHPRAYVALWNRGLVLMQIPGRENEARETIQRFLEESTLLDSDPEVAAFRSEAPTGIAEIDARVGSDASQEEDQRQDAVADRGGVLPVGPVVLGIGGALVVAGVILGGVAVSIDGDFESMCPTRMNCPESARPAYDNATTLATIADVIWLRGSVIGVTGLVLTLALDGTNSEAESAMRRSASHARRAD
jgi:tetratricopeptide (TPR) repeat protein